jgi:t-SNARE complex subunit (syntaxin)
MQTELAQHLSVQHSAIESLSKEAAEHTTNVRDGNVHLVAAREASKSSRFWFLFMVLLVSFVLLFLDWFATDNRSTKHYPPDIQAQAPSAQGFTDNIHIDM